MKKLLLIFAVFLLCGCNIVVTIGINDDGSYNEFIQAREPNMLSGDYYFFTFNHNYKEFQDKYDDLMFSSRFMGDMFQVTAERTNLRLDDIVTNLERYDEIIESVSFSRFGNPRNLRVTMREDFFTNYNFNSLEIYIRVPYEVTSYTNFTHISDTLYRATPDINNRTMEISFDRRHNTQAINHDNNHVFSLIVLGVIGGIVVIIIGVLLYLVSKKEKI